MADKPPLIWVLKGARAGDTAQAVFLAHSLGGRVEDVQLAFNASHALPNWLVGPRVSHLTAEARSLLAPPWPDLVVATGRRTAPVSLWIKQQSGGKAKAVQIGRPRMALTAFDLVITTPQYGLPHGANVVQAPVPLAANRPASESKQSAFAQAWSKLPRPWTLAVVGGSKFPMRLNADDLAGYGKALSRHVGVTGGSVILVDSPRSPKGALAQVATTLNAPHWMFQRGAGPNPYAAALALCDELTLTSDSVLMLTEMLATGKSTTVYRLPVSPFAPRWSAQTGLAAMLARAGVLHPPRNVAGFVQSLIDTGYVGDFASGTRPSKIFDVRGQQEEIVARVRSLLAVRTSS